MPFCFLNLTATLANCLAPELGLASHSVVLGGGWGGVERSAGVVRSLPADSQARTIFYLTCCSSRSFPNASRQQSEPCPLALGSGSSW